MHRLYPMTYCFPDKMPYTEPIIEILCLGSFMVQPTTSQGQGLVEYALLILLVGIAVIVMLALFGTAVGNMFSTVVANL